MTSFAVRVRIVMGAVFVVLGAASAVRLLMLPEPLNAKLLGLGFSLVLIALGVVRLRTYLPLRGGAQ